MANDLPSSSATRSGHRDEGPGKLALDGVSKTFRTRHGRVEALQEVDLTVGQGEFVSLVGPSGCGKSTLLMIAAGLEQPTTGQVYVDGRAAGAPGPDRCVVFQRFALFPAKTVWKNIEFGLRMAGFDAAARREKIRRQLAVTGLQGFERAYPHELSGGMQQRVAIARALVLEPQVLLMDEPFGSLDAQTRVVMQEEVTRICSDLNLTVLFVTHSVEEAVYLSDRVVVMSARPGRVKEVVTVPDLPGARLSMEAAMNDPRLGSLRSSIWHLVREEIGDLATPRESL